MNKSASVRFHLTSLFGNHLYSTSSIPYFTLAWLWAVKNRRFHDCSDFAFEIEMFSSYLIRICWNLYFITKFTVPDLLGNWRCDVSSVVLTDNFVENVNSLLAPDVTDIYGLQIAIDDSNCFDLSFLPACSDSELKILRSWDERGARRLSERWPKTD